MADVTSELIIASLGILGTVLGVLLTHFLERRRTSDKELFLAWQVAFDRPAWRGPYRWYSDHANYDKALAETIKAVDTGEGAGLKRGAGKAYIKNRRRRAEMDRVAVLLQELSILVPRFVEEYPVWGEESAAKAAQTRDAIDRRRDEIVSRLNAQWTDLGIRELPLPTQVRLDEARRE